MEAISDKSNPSVSLAGEVGEFLGLTAQPNTQIAGFRASYASALLAAYFPKTLPIVDRQVLKRPTIEHVVDGNGQVIDIANHYPNLLRRFRDELEVRPQFCVRELDREWFIRGSKINRALLWRRSWIMYNLYSITTNQGAIIALFRVVNRYVGNFSPMPGRFLFVAIFAFCICSAAKCAPIAADQVHVVDGDTIRVYHDAPDVRLVGFNAPETRRAQCPEERALGDQATRRLREIIGSGNLDFDFVDCSCPVGTEGTFSCNYGRSCGTLKANGLDVGKILISEHLAVQFQCGVTRCPKTPRPWCERPNLLTR